MTKKSGLSLSKPPINLEDKETPQQRLQKLDGFLTKELAMHGNSLYAQDLKLSIKALENRVNW